MCDNEECKVYEVMEAQRVRGMRTEPLCCIEEPQTIYGVLQYEV